MEFVDACKIMHEMCAAHRCDDCALWGYPCQLPREENAKKLEPILAQWRKEHPIKTMADHFFECFPNALKNESGVPDVCCRRVGLVTSEFCCEMPDCTTCWNREWKEEK